MNLRKLLLTENECYKVGRKHKVAGVMVHSTGANNPWLRRYVGPDDGLLGVNQYNNHWNEYRPGGRQVCVHAFIGKLANGNIATYQTLPFDIAGWHSGSGPKGNANFMGYVGFEICEDGLTDATYFNKVYKEAVEFTAYICNTYKLNPLKDGVVICHSEGHTRGIAENHSDVMHWFPKHGKSMDTFRADVAKLVKTTTNVSKTTYRVRKSWADASSQIGAYGSLANAKKACKVGYSVFDNNGKVVYRNVENVDVTYQAYTNGKWLGKIQNYNNVSTEGYAGIDKRAIQGLKIHLSTGNVQYRVHLKDNRWLNWITDDNNKIYSLSYAGIIGKDIDAIQIRLTGDLARTHQIFYRVSTVKSSQYLNWINGVSGSGILGYAGVFGQSIDRIQMYIKSK